MKSSIELKLTAFEGPLDLLLHLLEKAELSIKDVFVSEITEQYLLYMKQVDVLDMDMASEFLATAATLVYIKSRSLLPKPVMEGVEEETTEEMFIKQLEEYKKFKAISLVLAEQAEQTQRVFTRLPQEWIEQSNETVELQATEVDVLWRLFRRLTNKKRTGPQPLVHRVQKDEYTIERQMEYVQESIVACDTMNFLDLFHSPQRMEMIVTFMAVLELVAEGFIVVQQADRWDDISITKRKEQG